MDECDQLEAMDADEIKLNDWWRILMGEVPWSFILEVIIRSAIVFIILLISMRLLGKRMAGQLNKNEMIGLTTLAAATGVPIQAPDRGLLPPIIIAAIVVGIGTIISRWSFFNQKVETVSQGKIGILLEDSILQMSQMKFTKVTRERLFAQLRSKELTHLGQVKRVYFEAGGFFSMILNERPVAGLKIVPNWDTEYISELRFSNEVKVCSICGKTKNQNQQKCSNCHNDQWENACINLSAGG